MGGLRTTKSFLSPSSLLQLPSLCPLLDLANTLCYWKISKTPSTFKLLKPVTRLFYFSWRTWIDLSYLASMNFRKQWHKKLTSCLFFREKKNHIASGFKQCSGNTIYFFSIFQYSSVIIFAITILRTVTWKS